MTDPAQPSAWGTEVPAWEPEIPPWAEGAPVMPRGLQEHHESWTLGQPLPAEPALMADGLGNAETAVPPGHAPDQGIAAEPGQQYAELNERRPQGPRRIACANTSATSSFGADSGSCVNSYTGSDSRNGTASSFELAPAPALTITPAPVPAATSAPVPTPSPPSASDLAPAPASTLTPVPAPAPTSNYHHRHQPLPRSWHRRRQRCWICPCR